MMTADQCRSRRGGVVDSNSLTIADVQAAKDLNPGWATFNKLMVAATTTLQLLNERITNIVGLITEGQKST
jgi:hypothetical protein